MKTLTSFIKGLNAQHITKEESEETIEVNPGTDPSETEAKEEIITNKQS